ncbi:MAG: sulfotransferase [Proteobacteria bacterium]|nr:sulfotransferase [Pseudomonadota bacterium]
MTDTQTMSSSMEAVRAAEGALAFNDMASALTIAVEAVKAGADHPLLLNLAAHSLETQHRYAEAVELLERALEQAPDDLNLLCALGLCLSRSGRREASLAAFDAVLQVQPDFAPAHYGKGSAFELLGDLDGARRHYEAAAGLFPGYAEPLGGLASLAARRGDVAEARSLAERALAVDPSLTVARIALASARLGEKDLAGAEAAARDLLADPRLDPTDRPMVQALLGDALDGQDRAAEAFAAYAAGNAESREQHRAEYEGEGVETHLQLVRRIEAFLNGLKPGDWAPERVEDEGMGARAHVFLIGFPRSGTTLLEQIIATHPDVVSLEERPTLEDADAAYLIEPDGLGRLARASASELSDLQRRYWARVADYGVDPAGKVFIDKLPLNTVKLSIINALFPKAKVLFALRDPRDVVLSCFRRAFGMNPAMYQFTSLEGTATFYDAVMRLEQVSAERTPVEMAEVRYEDLIGDLEGEARQVCDFLGLEWTDDLKDFAEKSRERTIRTPSAKQVARGLYRGDGQWRRYEQELASVLPTLKPWLKRFGYEPAE